VQESIYIIVLKTLFLH